VGGSRAYWVVAVGLTLAFLVRASFVAATPDFEPVFDPAAFDRYGLSIARDGAYPDSTLARDGGPTAYRPPLYPAFLAAVYEVVGDRGSDERRWTAARLVQAAIGTATVALIGLLAFQLWGRRAALAALALAAVHPPLVLIGSSLLSEVLLLPLELAALAAVIQARRSNTPYPWAIAAGVLAGLATLTRPNAAILLVPLALAVWIRRPRRSARAIALPVVLAASAALTVAPWTLRNAIVMDSLVPVTTQFGYSLAGTYNDFSRRHRATWLDPASVAREYGPILRRTDLGEPALDERLRSKAADYVQDHPLYVLEVAYWNTIRVFHLGELEHARIHAKNMGIGRRPADIGIYSFYVLGLLALLGAWTGPARKAPAFVWLTPVLLLSSVLVNGGSRFRAPLEPFIVLLAALAAVALYDRLRALRRA
jgi:4-amino-4-deoxy-L-arabinose transferase-like glycosyltransferase